MHNTRFTESPIENKSSRPLRIGGSQQNGQNELHICTIPNRLRYLPTRYRSEGDNRGHVELRKLKKKKKVIPFIAFLPQYIPGVFNQRTIEARRAHTRTRAGARSSARFASIIPIISDDRRIFKTGQLSLSSSSRVTKRGRSGGGNGSNGSNSIYRYKRMTSPESEDT